MLKRQVQCRRPRLICISPPGMGSKRENTNHPLMLDSENGSEKATGQGQA